MIRTYDWIHWDGKTVGGGAPLWIVDAVRLGPSKPNGVMRLGSTVHCFGPDGTLAWIAEPGDFVLRDIETGDLMVQSESTIKTKFKQTNTGHLICDPLAAVGVKATSHPRLVRAFTAIRGEPLDEWLVPMAWVPRVPGTEAALVHATVGHGLVHWDSKNVSVAMAEELLESFKMEWEYAPVLPNIDAIVAEALVNAYGERGVLPDGADEEARTLITYCSDLERMPHWAVKSAVEKWIAR